VRGAPGNRRPYRDLSATATPLAFAAMPGAAKAVDCATLYASHAPMALTLD
jgi:hypothetical protein